MQALVAPSLAHRLADDGIDLFFGTPRFVGFDAVGVDSLRLRLKVAMIATRFRALLLMLRASTKPTI